MTMTIGADPEVFILDKTTGNYIDPMWVTFGTKQDPEPLGVGHIQADGCAIEFNIPPSNSEDEFVNNIKSMMQALNERVKEVNSDWDIVVTPIINWRGDIPFHALETGCDVDYNLNGKVNPKPTLVDKVRTGGGHIHIGYDTPKTRKEAFTKALEVAKVVNPHILKLQSSEASMERRKYYGNGAFRPKPYGVELRDLDNTWLLSEESIRQVYQTITGVLTNEAQVS
jgi:hypothetical protein